MKIVTSALFPLFLSPILQLGARQFNNTDEWFHYEGVDLTFWLPKSWKRVKVQEYDILQVISPDEGVAIMFVTMELHNVEAILGELQSTISTTVQDLKFTTKPEIGKLNGLDIVRMRGDAYSDNYPVKINVLLVQNQQKALLVFSIAGEESLEKYDAKIQSILDSIQPYEEEKDNLF